jgi:SAM-dependent methyltransferase
MTTDLVALEKWWVEYSEHYENRSWKDYRTFVADFVLYAEGTPLLDVGCGYGFLLECARRFGIPAIGLEGSESALERGRKLHPLIDIRMWHGGENLPFNDNCIGGAVLNEFVDHITVDQNELLFQELWRVLKPGGSLMVKSPSRYNQFDKDSGHVTFFSAIEFRKFAESFSFEVLHQPYIPLFRRSQFASLAQKCVTKIYKPDKWATRIDLVARKR